MIVDFRDACLVKRAGGKYWGEKSKAGTKGAAK